MNLKEQSGVIITLTKVTISVFTTNSFLIESLTNT